MKNKLNVGMFMVAVFFLALFPRAGMRPDLPERESGSVSVFGEAEVKVVPDEVRLTVGVESWHAELSVAKRKNDRIVESILDLAADFDIRPEDIQTDFINVNPGYDTSGILGTVEGYFVRKSIVLTLEDLDRFEDLLTAVTEAGATHVHGIEFRTSELRRYRDQARALAVQAAKEKASAMAGELGETIGSPQTISENHSGWYSWYGYAWWGSRSSSMYQNVVQEVGSGNFDAEGSFAPGQLSVTAKVSVTFTLDA